MNILMLSGSPKKKNSASNFFLNILKLFIVGHKVTTESLNSKKNTKRILELFDTIDALILSVPLYVDGMPSNVLEFMVKAEQYCNEHNCKFKLYVISNNGFIEGTQNKPHIKMYECWCEKSEIDWGGGVGIGGGVMLKVLSIVYPIIIAVFSINLLINILSGNIITFDLIRPIVENIGIYLFLNCGVIYAMIKLSHHIVTQKFLKNIFTRVMIPSFIFIPIASLFMIITSLFKGKLIFTLLGKDNIS